MEVLLTQLKHIDKFTDAKNVERYKEQLGKLSDTQFDSYMKQVRDKKACVYVYIPNMEKHPTMTDIISIAKTMGMSLFERVYIYDDLTGKKFLTPMSHFIARLPIRRMQQYGEHKMSVPEGDSKVDSLTGQVVHEDRAAGITNPEIQALGAKGLTELSKEVVSIRGGNIDAWQTGFKKQAEETGKIIMEDVTKDSKNRTVVVAQVLLESLHISNNISED